MQPTEFDEALRDIVAELAAATPDDVAAVLGMLDLRTAAQVRSLLAAYTKMENIFDLEADTGYLDTSGLSHWLADRVHGRPLSGANGYQMTENCTEALRALARSAPKSRGGAGGSVAGAKGPEDGNTRLQVLFGTGESV